MIRIALISLAAILFAESAYAHAIDFTARPESYAAQPKRGYFIMTPPNAGRGAYPGAPAGRFEYMAPPAGSEMYR